MLNWLACGTRIACVVHDCPPLVVRDRIASLRSECGRPLNELRLSLGNRLRSQMAYTKFESNGSAVMEFLSLKLKGLSSSMRTVGALHVRPPSVDLFTSIAESLPALVASDIAYATPFGEKVTHGSVARR